MKQPTKKKKKKTQQTLNNQKPSNLNPQLETHKEHSKLQERNPNKPTTTKALKPKTHKEHSTLQHLSLSFPSPRRHACIAVVNEAFQIQHLSLPFDLKTRTLFKPKDLLFNGISNPIQGHVGMTDTQGVKKISPDGQNFLSFLFSNSIPLLETRRPLCLIIWAYPVPLSIGILVSLGLRMIGNWNMPSNIQELLHCWIVQGRGHSKEAIWKVISALLM
jgi:hypothetical protein